MMALNMEGLMEASQTAVADSLDEYSNERYCGRGT